MICSLLWNNVRNLAKKGIKVNYKWLAFLVIAITFFFETYIEWLKIKSAKRPIPDNVKDIYDKQSYNKWLAYYGEKTKLSFIRHTISYLTVFFIIGLNVYANIVKQLSLKGDYLAAVGVLIADILISLIYSVPHEYMDAMIVEQKYGFNRMTKKTFFIDQIKDVVLDIILTSGICCLFIFLHRTLGDWLLLVFTGIMLIFVLLIVFLAPAIGKIKNKFEPLPDGKLKERLFALLLENGCTVKAIYVMDGSKRSSKANAYFSGFGKSKTIVLYDTLLEQMSEDEIVAVFAHEMGHNKHKDTLKMYGISILNVVVCVFAAWKLVSVPKIYLDFGFEKLNYGFAFYLLATVFLAFFSPFFGLFSGVLSRRAEYAADRFAAENGYKEALISALKVLSKNSFSCLAPHPLLVALTNTHPTVSQRISALEYIPKKE